jgi:hypothetical protein
LRESEKNKLDNWLHIEIIKRIVTIQRWMRTRIQRNSFLRLREAAVRIQSQVKFINTTQISRLVCRSLLIRSFWESVSECILL